MFVSHHYDHRHHHQCIPPPPPKHHHQNTPPPPCFVAPVCIEKTEKRRAYWTRSTEQIPARVKVTNVDCWNGRHFLAGIQRNLSQHENQNAGVDVSTVVNRRKVVSGQIWRERLSISGNSGEDRAHIAMVSLLVPPNVAAQQWLPSTNTFPIQTQSAFEERDRETLWRNHDQPWTIEPVS